MLTTDERRLIPHSRLSRIDIILFCLLAGVLGTLTFGYTFPTENHTCHLPIVLRSVDPDYLTNDFFVDANTKTIGPRYYYAQVLALLIRVLPVHAVFLLLTITAKFMMALVTFHVASRLFGRESLASVFAVALVLGVTAFNLGGATGLAESGLEPALLVRPVALLSLWAALQGRIISCIILAMIAIPIHPLVGLETPVVGLAAFAGYSVLVAITGVPKGNGRTLVNISCSVIAAAALIVYLHLIFGNLTTQSITDTQFIHILCECRAPHHYLPSTFPKTHYVLAACFMAAMGLSWHSWNRESCNPALVGKVLLTIVTVIALLFLGYIFVEIIPSRTVASAQVFRLLFIIKWIGFLLFAGTAERALTRRQTSSPGWCILFCSGMYQPILVMVANTLVSFRGRLRSLLGALSPTLLTCFTLLLVGVCLLVANPNELRSVALIAMLGMVFLWLSHSVALRFGFVAVAGAILAMFLAHSVGTTRSQQLGVLTQKDPCWAAAAFVRQNTPQDAVICVPPDIGQFRVLAKRALLVQWKTFPFSDKAMTEWYNRMVDCYGGLSSTTSLSELARRYRAISDSQIRHISKKYDCTLAILYSDTPTTLEVLFQDSTYKLVTTDIHHHKEVIPGNRLVDLRANGSQD